MQQAPGSDRAVCQPRFSASCSNFLSSAEALTQSPSFLFYYNVKTPPSFDRSLAPAASMLIHFRGGKAPDHFLFSFRPSSVVSTGSLRRLLTAYIATKTTQRLVTVKGTEKCLRQQFSKADVEDDSTFQDRSNQPALQGDFTG